MFMLFDAEYLNVLIRRSRRKGERKQIVRNKNPWKTAICLFCDELPSVCPHGLVCFACVGFSDCYCLFVFCLPQLLLSDKTSLTRIVPSRLTGHLKHIAVLFLTLSTPHSKPHFTAPFHRKYPCKSHAVGAICKIWEKLGTRTLGAT